MGLLAYATGLVNQRLLLQNEYLMAENRILRAHLPIVCASEIRKGPRWPKSASVWAAKRSPVTVVARPGVIS